LQDSAVALGAQDLYYEPDGAFTGEVSGAMLADVGCRYVLIGHSERRHVLGETDSNVHSKLRAALEADLHPVVCVGERLEEREQDRTEAVVRRQLTTALEGVSADELRRVTIAYEPVWAIGTGKTATPDQAQAVHLYLRNLVSDRYNHVAAGEVRILYGGSVKPENALSLLEQADLDGALVGGASLNADAFLAIVAAARSAARS
jgi:triosephosphate isomerase